MVFGNKIYKNFPKNIIFPKGFPLNRMKNIFLDLKSWGPLINFKVRSGSYSGLGLSIYFKKPN
jgi:hypothetical protein